MLKIVASLQIYEGDPRICTSFIPAWGSNCGYSGFSSGQKNCDLSGACVLQSEHEDTHAWNTVRCAKIVDAILLVFVSACVVIENMNIPNWSSMADDPILQSIIGVLGSPFCNCVPMTDDAITRGGIQGLGSPLYTMYICEQVY